MLALARAVPPAASWTRALPAMTLPFSRTERLVLVKNVTWTVRLVPAANVPRSHVTSRPAAHETGNVPSSETLAQPLVPAIPAGTGTKSCTAVGTARRFVTVIS